MLDRYMIGDVQRISPEAPVPVVELKKEEDRLGGAANVALNIISLGAEVVLASVIGSDVYGQRIIELCSENKIDSRTILQLPSRPTTVKTRILGNKQQLLRVDYEVNEYLNEGDEQLFLDFVIPEMKEGTWISFNFPAEKQIFESAISKLNEKIQNSFTFVTLSEFGVAISDHSSVDYIDAHVRTISDVSGAGDTVIAVATLCLCSGCSIKELAQISNLAGGLVCEKSGVVSINTTELVEEVEKLFNLNLVKQ